MPERGGTLKITLGVDPPLWIVCIPLVSVGAFPQPPEAAAGAAPGDADTLPSPPYTVSTLTKATSNAMIATDPKTALRFCIASLSVESIRTIGSTQMV